MAERGEVRIVENGGGRLIENCRTRLIYLGRRATVAWGNIGAGEIQELRGAWLIAREIIAWEKDALQSGVRGIDAGVDVRDDAGAGHLKAILRIRKPNNRCRRLVGV